MNPDTAARLWATVCVAARMAALCIPPIMAISHLANTWAPTATRPADHLSASVWLRRAASTALFGVVLYATYVVITATLGDLLAATDALLDPPVTQRAR